MKFRIIAVQNIAPLPVYQVQVKTWWGKWKSIKDWYQPEIGEMPGWWSEYFVEIKEAETAIKNYLSRKPQQIKIV